MSKQNEKTVDEAAKAKTDAESTEGLVKMHKLGETLYVHPTTVESHKAVGWKLV